ERLADLVVIPGVLEVEPGLELLGHPEERGGVEAEAERRDLRGRVHDAGLLAVAGGDREEGARRAIESAQVRLFLRRDQVAGVILREPFLGVGVVPRAYPVDLHNAHFLSRLAEPSFGLPRLCRRNWDAQFD